MKKAVCVLIYLMAILLMSTSIKAEDEMGPQHMLAIAKITGACGIMGEMISFQKKTQLAGGDEFVVRFWQAEAARLGKTIEKYHSDCEDAIALYDTFWKLTDSKD